MKISFVIPAFNEEGYLGSCLDSIIREANNASCEVEIIVVNNASNDNTVKIASAYSAVRVVDERRKGLTYARQAGFLASSGDLIANVDADAVLPKGWIDKVINAFKDENLVALSGPVVYHDLSLGSNILVRIYYYLAYLSYWVNRHILRASSLLQGGNFVVRRDALLEVGGYNTAFTFYGEDAEIARRLNQVGPVLFTLSLPMYSSGRRLKAEGIVTMGWKYPINYLWTNIFKKPYHTEFLDFRTPQKGENFQTTIPKLDLVMRRVGLIATSLVLILGLAGVYLYGIIFTSPLSTFAEAHDSSSFIVRKFGPEIANIRANIQKIKMGIKD